MHNDTDKYYNFFKRNYIAIKMIPVDDIKFLIIYNDTDRYITVLFMYNGTRMVHEFFLKNYIPCQ